MNKAIYHSFFATGLIFSLQAQALDYGPFSLTGFGKADGTQVSDLCRNCQLETNENKQRSWADYMVPGRPIESGWTHVTLFQPYLGAKFDLGGGYKVSGLLSQRWRDGSLDVPGYVYERNIGLSHENFGSIRYGAMTTRGWSLADFPYGTNLNVADAWGSSGAGYGLLQNAVRYISPKFDVFEGDMVLEGSYDQGDKGFKIHKGRFIEFYAQYVKGDLVLDFVNQDTKNGQPQSWTHGPFIGLTPNAIDDAKLSDASQSITMLMGRYQYTNQLEISGGIRRNRWSGAAAVITGTQNGHSLWNSMFNVDWGATLNGVPNPGYSAQSTDYLFGARYRMNDWTASVGMVHFGIASTSNPEERGQSNSALITTAGLNYDFGRGLAAYASIGQIHYKQLGLSPMTMPSNSAFTQVDSRVSRSGNWGGAGLVYTF